MVVTRCFRSLAGAGMGVVMVAGTSAAFAINGNNAIQYSTSAGWDGFEIVTQGNNISAISDAGYGATASRGTYDGLGTYLDGNTLSIFVNHEVTNDAAISRVDVDLDTFRQAINSTIDGGTTPFPSSFVTGMGYAYDRIFDGGYHAISNPNPVATGTVAVGAYSSANLSRLCSGTSYMPDSFGAGRGFVDQMYITGEEVFNTTGRFYAIDPMTQTLWEAPDLGGGSWENAALVDTGNTTHTALFLSEDDTGSPIRLYVGEKGMDSNGDGEVDFLERNGLRGGTTYYFKPNAGSSTTDLPNGTVSGTWSTSLSGALTEDKLEDVHTNPFDGTELVFADQTDGLYTMDLNLQFNGGSLDTATSGATIDQIVPESGINSLGNPDNLTWADDGKLYVQQDGAGDGMWQMDDDGTNRVQIATGFSEPSGIVDISTLLGYAPGSVLLTSLQGSGSSGGQLGTLISPNAMRLLQGGDLDGDGFVGIDDLNLVLANWNQNVPPGDPRADPSGDGFVGIDDLNVILSNWNAGTPPSANPSASVPEPATVAILGMAAGMLSWGNRYGAGR